VDTFSFLNFYLIPGIILGSIYALGAIGVTLVFGVLRFAHLAHGDLATMGAFLTLAIVWLLGINPWVALPIAMALSAVLAILIDRAFYDYLREKPVILTVMASLGMALMLRSIVQVAWGTDAESFTRGIVRPDDYFGLRLKSREIWTLLSTFAIVFVLEGFLRKTKWGKAMRAMSDNPDLAGITGIDTRTVRALTWGIVGALCAATGFFLGINTELRSMMGWHMLLPMFAAAVLGGVGRVEGAVLGGFIIGLAEELSVIIFPAEYKTAVAFSILLFMLLVKPTGLLRGKIL
jgi:branched-chain amino acid transport system permease protein